MSSICFIANSKNSGLGRFRWSVFKEMMSTPSKSGIETEAELDDNDNAGDANSLVKKGSLLTANNIDSGAVLEWLNTWLNSFQNSNEGMKKKSNMNYALTIFVQWQWCFILLHLSLCMELTRNQSHRRAICMSQTILAILPDADFNIAM